MLLTLKWNELNLEKWSSLFETIPRSNLLQSYPYALAYSRHERQKPRFGHIDIDGQIAGLFQVFETSLFFGALHTIILDRGPLWLPGFGGAAHTKLFFEELNKNFPQRLGRARRIIPETEHGSTAEKILESAGFEKLQGRPGYQTIWLDLTPEEETLRANLKQKWRNMLNKADRSGLEIKWDWEADLYHDFRQGYIMDKAARGYPGISPKFLDVLAPISAQSGDMLIGQATLSGKIAASVLFLRHGRSATYLAGWTNQLGRDSAAHNLLLWQALPGLKEAGVQELDLGGINDDSAKGVKTFKEGLGGKSITLAGHYR